MIDSSGAADAMNENWPEVTCMDGACWGYAQNDWAPSQGDLMAGMSIGKMLMIVNPGDVCSQAAVMQLSDLDTIFALPLTL